MPQSRSVAPSQPATELRMPVSARHVGPLLAALRQQRGYQFVVETDRHGETAAWLVKTALRIL